MVKKKLKRRPKGIRKPTVDPRGAGTKTLPPSLTHPMNQQRYYRKPVKRLVGRPRKYPWDEWMDGSTWLVKKGVDFDIETLQFQRVLIKHGWRHGYFVETARWKDGLHLYFRFYTGRKEPKMLRSQLGRDTGFAF